MLTMLYSCTVHVVGSLLYLTKGSATVQDWAVPVLQSKDRSEEVTEGEDGFTEIKL